MKHSSAPVHAASLAALVSLLAFSACGEDSPSEEATAGTGGSTTSSGGKSTSGGSKSGSSGGDTSAGAPGDAGQGSGATGSGSGGSGNTGNTGSGGEPAGSQGGSAGEIQVPDPVEGTSVYAVECSGETEMCMSEHAHCLGIMTEQGNGFACSNHCETVDDCSDAPTGAEAEPSCIQFTMQKRCMLLCYSSGTEYACPDGMSCYIYENSPIGYCLWGL